MPAGQAAPHIFRRCPGRPPGRSLCTVCPHPTHRNRPCSGAGGRGADGLFTSHPGQSLIHHGHFASTTAGARIPLPPSGLRRSCPQAGARVHTALVQRRSCSFRCAALRTPPPGRPLYSDAAGRRSAGPFRLPTRRRAGSGVKMWHNASFFTGCFAGFKCNIFYNKIPFCKFICMYSIQLCKFSGMKQEAPSRPDSMKALDELFERRQNGTADSTLRNPSDIGALCEQGDSTACLTLGLMKLEVCPQIPSPCSQTPDARHLLPGPRCHTGHTGCIRLLRTRMLGQKCKGLLLPRSRVRRTRGLRWTRLASQRNQGAHTRRAPILVAVMSVE